LEDAETVVEFVKKFELIDAASAGKIDLKELDLSDLDAVIQTIPK
jgi:hypothetical protein